MARFHRAGSRPRGTLHPSLENALTSAIPSSYGRIPRKVFVPRLSIVIPALASVEALERTLVSVLEKRPADCEIIVVLNTSYDDPYQLTDEVHFASARKGQAGPKVQSPDWPFRGRQS